MNNLQQEQQQQQVIIALTTMQRSSSVADKGGQEQDVSQSPVPKQDASDDSHSDKELDTKPPLTRRKTEKQASKLSMLFKRARDEDDDEEYEAEKSNLCNFFFYLVVGCLVFMAPAVYFMISDPTTVPVLNPLLSEADLRIGGQLRPEAECVRWLIWLASTWAMCVANWYFLGYLPSLIVILITRVHGFCSERFRERLELIPSGRWFVWLFLTALFGVAFFVILFTQFPSISKWNSFFEFLIVCLIFTAMLVLQRFFVLSLADNFHRHSYQDRIEEVRKASEILDSMRKVLKQRGIYDIAKEKARMDHFGSTEQVKRSAPLFGMFKKQNKVEMVNEITRDLEKDKIDIVIPPQVGENTSPTESTVHQNTAIIDERMRKGILIGEKKRLHGHKSLDLLSEKNGIRLSKKLFNALCPPGKNMITIDQFYNIFETEKEATEAFKTLDRDNNGSLTFKELKRAILHIYRERRNLFRSLGDLSQALGILNSIFYCISLLLTLLTALPFWGINVNAIVPFTSILLTLSFIFGSAVSNMFNCMIFIFVHHPYDTGDRIWINDVNYVVAQLNLLNTVLIRSDGHRVYMPNNEIASKSIHNIRRSGDMAEPISVEIGFYTPEEKLQQLERNMNAFIDSNPRDYLPGMFINVSELDHCNSVKISFWLSYKGNWQDSGYRIKRRSAFVRHLRLQLMQLEIRFYFPPQPFINDDFKTEGARALMGQNPAA